MKVTFDSAKDEINATKHGLSLSQATELEWDTVLSTQDTRHDYGEKREIGYGLIGNRLFCVVFARREDSLRIISFRKANRREVKKYVKQTHDFITDR